MSALLVMMVRVSYSRYPPLTVILSLDELGSLPGIVDPLLGSFLVTLVAGHFFVDENL